MVKKLIFILLIMGIIGLTPLYCLAEEEGNIPLKIGVGELISQF